MNMTVGWTDIALRLGAALLAGGLIGYDRGARGHAAGLRTTILMCLAATGAMIEANLMLGVTGKTAASFATMDALRFPLGILSGIGFIGAGAIVRRGNLVTGVTTAATIWLITVIGLILGAGYLSFGAAVTIIAFLVLTGLKRLEPHIYHAHRARLALKTKPDGPSNEELRAAVAAAGYTPISFAIRYDDGRCLEWRLEWFSGKDTNQAPALVERLAARPGIASVSWEPISANPILTE